MRRVLLIGILIGWLLGIATSLLAPAVLYERQTIASQVETTVRSRTTGAVNDGWEITGTETVAGMAVVKLRRPRLRIPTD